MESVLIVCATLPECQGLLKPDFKYSDSTSHFIEPFANFKADLLITGVGGFATTFHLTRLLSSTKYELILNIGVAGSYNRNWPLGTVVMVQCDQFGDLGAEDNEDFIDLFDMGLANPSNQPYKDGKLTPLPNKLLVNTQLVNAQGITVNKVHGNSRSIEKIIDKYLAEIETMEGAAVFYTANMFGISSVQIRAISNYVEPRNKANWQLVLALNNLFVETLKIMKSFIY